MKEEVLNHAIVIKNEHFDAYSKAERPLNSNKKNKTTTSAILYVTDLDKRYNAKCLDWSKSLEAGAYFYGKCFWKLTSIEQSSELSFLDYPVTDQPNKFLHELVARSRLPGKIKFDSILNNDYSSLFTPAKKINQLPM